MTAKQLGHVASLMDQQGMTTGKFQDRQPFVVKVFDYYADTSPQALAAVHQALGLHLFDPEQLRFTIDYSKVSRDDFDLGKDRRKVREWANSKYHWVDDRLFFAGGKPRNWGRTHHQYLGGAGPVLYEGKFFRFDWRMEEKDIDEKIDRHDQKKPWRRARVRDLLVFGPQCLRAEHYPRVQRVVGPRLENGWFSDICLGENGRMSAGAMVNEVLSQEVSEDPILCFLAVRQVRE